jgi:hypothetical protein
MMKLSTWRRIASRQIRYRSLLQERMKALLVTRIPKDTPTVLALGKLMQRVLRHRKRMARLENQCAVILHASERIH